MSTANLPATRALTINKGVPRQLFNRFVVGLLRSRWHGLGGFDRFGMVLTYTGKKTGKQYTLPLAYTRDGDTITTFALFTNTIWWKNLRNNAPVVVRLQGKEYAGVATVIRNVDQVAQGLLTFTANGPQQRGGYYSVPRTADGSIDHAALREAAQTRVMIQITLTGETKPKPRDREFSPRYKAGMRLFTALHVLVYRLTGGRVWNRLGPGPVLLLTVRGRKTGKQYTTPLCYLRDGDRLVLVGSAGGSATHPGWVRNLESTPRALVQIGSRRREMRAEVAVGAERERLWQRLLDQSVYWGDMQQASSRQFPIMILTPRT